MSDRKTSIGEDRKEARFGKMQTIFALDEPINNEGECGIRNTPSAKSLHQLYSYNT